MKKFTLLCVVICSLMMFSGCGVMRHMTFNSNLTQTQVHLASNNYRIVGRVVGEATDTYVLGIGGWNKSALANNSYANMVKNANLKNSQTIIHITTTAKERFVLFVYEVTYVTSGVIIEFVGENQIPNEMPLELQSAGAEGRTNQLWSSVFENFDFDNFFSLPRKEQEQQRKAIYQNLDSRCKILKNDPSLKDDNIDV